ncbi:MAG: molybdenum cofactor biosynthesis protein MoaE [Pseudomonadota bacterium]
MRTVRLESAPFDASAEVDRLSHAMPNAGGVASFVGKVRAAGGVEALELSHYEPLTLTGMQELGDAAFDRFDLMGLLMIHRVGLMRAGESIVCVAAAARHRRDAIEAVDFCMDHLKSAAWFWKRENRGGQWHWIEPRDADHSDLARWSD